VTPAQFRKIALALPHAVEGAHMGHPDFRVGGKIFASLYEGGGTVKLTPEEQEMRIAAAPEMFSPAAGAWGRRGWTRMHLKAIDAASARSALAAAWRNTAPRKLLA
jgi:hypothetical protein